MAEGVDTPLRAGDDAHTALPPRRGGVVARPRSAGWAVLRALRPKQWLKNVLVLAAPAAAGVLTEGDVLAETALAFVAFCLAASGIYLLNDVGDLEADRLHPVKRDRPVPAGEVAVPVAVALGIALVAGGLAVAALVRLELLVVVAVYVALTVTYTVWLKHVAVVDLVAIALGFILRAVAGGVAVEVPLSRWFIIVASFGSLFVVAGKRHGERTHAGDYSGPTRLTLEAYSITYLRYVWTMSASVAVAAYCLWAFEQTTPEDSVPLYELSIVPFVTFILRYALLLDNGHGGAPEDTVLSDRTLLALAGVWLVVFGCGVYFLG